jgi:hypothetical protein
MLRIFEHKKDEVSEEGRTLHNEEPCYLYLSASIVKVMTLRISQNLKWGDKKCVCVYMYIVLVGNPFHSDHFEDLGGRKIMFWGPPSLLSNGYQGSFPGGKAAGA